ncbi:MAG TPA: FkbM family methyltransferase [Candidatus Portnoybacteria bacterium]|nr:FkbM family methyltransferase [Candidatus Portnoybacteria bacterium]
MNKFLKKINTLRHLDFKWALRYYRKKMRLCFSYYFSLLKNVKFFEADIDGVKVKLSFNHYYHHHKAWAIFKGRHEKDDLKLWKNKSKAKRVVFDIGGYNGIYGLISAVVNPQSVVYIFEPEPINCDCIKRNIELNGLKNVFLVQAAISDKSSKVLFDVHQGGTGGKISSGGLEIDCWSLDDFAQKNQPPDLIKCDIEGAEYLALLGGKNILAANKPEILLEVHKKFLKRFGHTENNVYELLEELGYKKEKIDETESSAHYWVSKI